MSLLPYAQDVLVMWGIFLCSSVLISPQAGEIATMKAKVDESEGQRNAHEDHIKTLKVS